MLIRKLNPKKISCKLVFHPFPLVSPFRRNGLIDISSRSIKTMITIADNSGSTKSTPTKYESLELLNMMLNGN